MLASYSNEVWCCEFSPDSTLLATGTEAEDCGQVVVWNTDDWTINRRISLSKRLIAGLSFHPTAPWLAVSSFDGSVSVIDFRTGNTIEEPRPSLPQSKRLSAASMDIEFSRDGHWLAAARKARGIDIWQVFAVGATTSQKGTVWPTGSLLSQPIQVKPPNQRIWAIAFDPATNRLALASETGQVDLLQVGDFSHLVSNRSGLTRLRAIEFSPDGRFLATSTWSSPGVA